MTQVAVQLPPSGLSPNKIRSTHWRNAQKARGPYQADCRQRIIAAKITELPVPLIIHYEFFTAATKVDTNGKSIRVPDGRYRPHDEDNARGSMKSFQDLLVEMNLIPNDRRGTVRVGSTKINNAKESKGQQGVLVTFKGENE